MTRSPLRAALAATLLLSLTTGCARMTASGDKVACGAFEPIRWAVEDTDETIRQVKAHNAAGRALGCW